MAENRLLSGHVRSSATFKSYYRVDVQTACRSEWFGFSWRPVSLSLCFICRQEQIKLMEQSWIRKHKVLILFALFPQNCWTSQKHRRPHIIAGLYYMCFLAELHNCFCRFCRETAAEMVKSVVTADFLSVIKLTSRNQSDLLWLTVNFVVDNGKSHVAYFRLLCILNWQEAENCTLSSLCYKMAAGEKLAWSRISVKL